MDEKLACKLGDVGLQAADFGDPADAWRRLHEHFGTRATLLDRYALEAAARGLGVDELDGELKASLTLEVLAAHAPGFEIVAGSERSRRDPVAVVDYDPAWPRRFASWRRRLAAALGRTARRLEHVGSTAVPGLAAKPVIDVQVSVPDPDDEPAYVPQIERLGVAFRSRDADHRYFRPAIDRPRDVQIHVCAVGSRWERDHVLFRDYLRSHREAAETYGTLKREFAERYRTDRIAYNEAKTEFILAQMDQAERWAADTGWRLSA